MLVLALVLALHLLFGLMLWSEMQPAPVDSSPRASINISRRRTRQRVVRWAPYRRCDPGDRLNLPSPSLVGDPHPVKPLPLPTCIAEYNDDKPLSYGCPVNTPDLAFQAEMRVCIDLFRAGKRLKAWCPADTPKRAAAESSTPPAASSSMGSH